MNKVYVTYRDTLQIQRHRYFKSQKSRQKYTIESLYKMGPGWPYCDHLSRLLDKIANKDKRYFTTIKVSINREEITITKIYTSNNKCPKHIKQNLYEPNGEKYQFNNNQEFDTTYSLI